VFITPIEEYSFEKLLAIFIARLKYFLGISDLTFCKEDIFNENIFLLKFFIFSF
jgi:hypothetical protein